MLCQRLRKACNVPDNADGIGRPHNVQLEAPYSLISLHELAVEIAS